MAYFDKYGVEFSDERKTLVKCPKVFKGEYIIPNSVTSIGEEAFEDCDSLTSVTFQNSVTSIGYWAFRGCSDLKEIIVPLGQEERFRKMLDYEYAGLIRTTSSPRLQ